MLRSLLEPDPRNRASSATAVLAALRDPKPSTPGPRPSATTARAETGETSQALAIPGIVQELAQTPKPVSILVWLAALMGAGALAIFEYLILPVVYLILRAAADNKRNKGQAIDDDKAGITSLREFRRGASEQRQLVAHVIRNTSPLRDEPPALPPGEDRDKTKR